MPPKTDAKPSVSKLRCTRLLPGDRVVVHLPGEDIEGTVSHDPQFVDLDRRAKDASLHQYGADDSFGRSTRVDTHPSHCSPLTESNAAKCPHCGESLP